MPRWYGAFRCVGKPQVVLSQIAAKVRYDDLGRFVPRVYFEKRPRREFYLCLAIVSEPEGVPPREVEGLLALSCLSSPVRADGGRLRPFSRAEIDRFVGAGADVQDYARRIQRRRTAPLPVEDPFGPAYGEVVDPDDAADVVGRTALFDRLLLWLSAAGAGSFATFQQACRTLGLVKPGVEPRQILRRLRLLGHVETSPDGGRWSIAPTALTRLAGTEETLALCGARDEPLRSALRAAAAIEDVTQPGGGGPAALLARGRPAAQVARALRAAGADDLPEPECAAERLAALLPPIDAWADSLQQVPGIVPTLYDCRRFDGVDFRDVPFAGRAGLYELWQPERDAGPTAPRYTLYHDPAHDRWLRGDWYGLRYLARMAAGGVCEVEWDQGEGRLSVPDGWRWPELYERALVLASGRLPGRHGERLVYDAISARLIDLLAPSLRLHVSEVSIRCTT